MPTLFARQDARQKGNYCLDLEYSLARVVGENPSFDVLLATVDTHDVR